MSPSDDSTRPISVAELLARNGTIGAPPMGGRRRRRRGNSQAVTVAELTGEIPVIRDEEIPVVVEAEEEAEGEALADVAEEVSEDDVEVVVEDVAEEVTEDVVEDVVDDVAEESAPESSETVIIYSGYSESVDGADPVESVDGADPVESIDGADPVDYTDYADPVDYTDTEDQVVEPEPEPVVDAVSEIAEPPGTEAPLLSSPPWTRRKKKGPELSHDPRPARRKSGAEQMTYDPVDQSVDLSGLVDNQVDNAEELRSYLQSSGGTLFSGETVADDLARRGVTEVDELATADTATVSSSPPSEARLTALRHALIAILQSVLAVVFGAGLFIAFDQLWRWNNIVALVLSVLVILGLVIAVRVVRKTEDIASTLIAVAVGALVTLGPLALLQST